MDYDNTNRGALFKNYRKDKETQPDYKGDINVNGTEMWISAWLSTSKAGKPYMSLSVQTKEEQAATPAAQPAMDAIDDAIPF
jgi:uncharacterized protein (DUF736 family)